jgi:hypothetical protein
MLSIFKAVKTGIGFHPQSCAFRARSKAISAVADGFQAIVFYK